MHVPTPPPSPRAFCPRFRSADVEQRVLILGKYMFNIQNWIAKTATKVLFTRSEVAADLPPALAAHYAHIEGFDDFETSGACGTVC